MNIYLNTVVFIDSFVEYSNVINMSDSIYLFTDGSVNPSKKVGYGAVLLAKDINKPLEVIKTQVNLKRFTNTSSTKLELENLLWGMGLVIEKGYNNIIIYTDSQNVISLISRRSRLENNNYNTKGNKPVKNQQLYQEFFRLFDSFEIEIIKIKGHQPGRDKSEIEKIFTLVDKASRKALREEFDNNN